VKRIISISLGSSRRDYRTQTTVHGQPIVIERFGTNRNVAHATELVQAYDGTVDAISLTGLTPVFHIGNVRYLHCKAIHVAAQACTTPVLDGRKLKATLERWTVKRAADIVPGLFRSRRVLFLSGIDRYPLAQAIAAHTSHLRFADPLVQMGVPYLPPLRSLKQLERYVSAMLPLTAFPSYRMLHRLVQRRRKEPRSHNPHLEKLFNWAHIIVGDYETIYRFAPDDLRGRTIITDDPAPAEIDELRERGVTTLVTMTPPLPGERPFVSTDVLEALVTVALGKGEPDEAEVLDFISRNRWEPTVQHLNQSTARPRFAFVVHPLRTSHLLLHPRFGFMRYLPERLVEWGAAYMPPLYLSRIRGIRSNATGEEVEGLLFSLGSTPREIMRRSPHFTYKRLVQAARIAERKGARIMGLGAFTSVVGDAGVTVAQQTDIGVTSGNSLTVAATLEAAKRAVRLMGGRTDSGRAIVIGATGSIGAVCARLLAQAIGNVVLIAPRPERLLALKMQIEQETPGAVVIAATSSAAYISSADLIITTTSSFQGRVLDIERVKPGAVICDVARPPNVTREEAERRPDVLVIESGEMHLPGEPDFGFNIDLPPGTAYACLAETALLAMDGRFADYTLGREIAMEQVKEMYRLMKKHGLELANLRSFGQEITEATIAEKRRLAEQRYCSLAVSV
jgi:predicted amino acid dehydrogenase